MFAHKMMDSIEVYTPPDSATTDHFVEMLRCAIPFTRDKLTHALMEVLATMVNAQPALIKNPVGCDAGWVLSAVRGEHSVGIDIAIRTDDSPTTCILAALDMPLIKDYTLAEHHIRLDRNTRIRDMRTSSPDDVSHEALWAWCDVFYTALTDAEVFDITYTVGHDPAPHYIIPSVVHPDHIKAVLNL